MAQKEEMVNSSFSGVTHAYDALKVMYAILGLKRQMESQGNPSWTDFEALISWVHRVTFDQTPRDSKGHPIIAMSVPHLPPLEEILDQREGFQVKCEEQRHWPAEFMVELRKMEDHFSNLFRILERYVEDINRRITDLESARGTAELIKPKTKQRPRSLTVERRRKIAWRAARDHNGKGDLDRFTCKQFDEEEIPLPKKWASISEARSWSEAYRENKLRDRLHKMLSDDRRKG